MNRARKSHYSPYLNMTPSVLTNGSAFHHYTDRRQYNPYMNIPMWNGGMENMHPGYFSQQMAPQGVYGNYEQQQYFHPQNNYPKLSHDVFQNPLQYQNNAYTAANLKQNNQQGYMNPYPKQSFIPKKQSGVQNIMNSFKGQDGSLDFTKMMDTAGMMMSAVNQVGGLVKGVGGIFKV
ncbi:YppG family protein [Niallia sp. 03133]|uniref:YppG family protein n=1 Tax=Niallia sp. 03133 TaxID=3458060 RepID=UPI0040443FA1